MYREILLNTFENIFKNSNNLIVKLIIPILLITFINYFIPIFINEQFISMIQSNTFDPKTLLIPIIIVFAHTMLNISLAITVHRVIILGDKSMPKYGSYIFGLREFKFLFKSILFAIIVIIPTFLLALIPFVGIFLAPILALIIASRLSLIFPANACEHNISFLDTWKITKKYKLVTFVMVIIFPIIFSLTVGLVYTFAIEFLIKLVSPHLAVLYSILNLIIIVFSISAISSVYIFIKPKPLNQIRKLEEEPLKEILEVSKRNMHKIVIEDRYNVTFKALQKELNEQYLDFGFTEIAYDRENSWLIKNPNKEEDYISLRYDNNEYTILVKNVDKPNLKILNAPDK